MNSISTTRSQRFQHDLFQTLHTFAAEAAAFFKAIASPSTLIAEVEHMHALQCEAQRLDTSDPARAADLRQQASRIGLG